VKQPKKKLRRRAAARYQPYGSRTLPPFVTFEEMESAPRPSPAQAARYLRTHAVVTRLKRDDEATQERDTKIMQIALYVIANCIEKLPGWTFKKGGTLHIEQEQLLDGVARWKAPPGVSQEEFDEQNARDVARQSGMNGPDDHEAVRDLIVETRKRRGRRRRG